MESHNVSIEIRRKHGQSLRQAEAAVEKTAAAIGKKFDIESEWSGNTLKFSRPVSVRSTSRQPKSTSAELGFLLGMLRPAIEERGKARSNWPNNSARAAMSPGNATFPHCGVLIVNILSALSTV
jgi:putative polyhydroxyalkanoate system protein